MPKYRVYYKDGTSKVIFYKNRELLQKWEKDVVDFKILNGVVITPKSEEVFDSKTARNFYEPLMLRGWSKYR